MRFRLNMLPGNKIEAIDVISGKSIAFDSLDVEIRHFEDDCYRYTGKLRVGDNLLADILLRREAVKAIEIETDEQSEYEPVLKRYLGLD
jgi:hypothetical protein